MSSLGNRIKGLLKLSDLPTDAKKFIESEGILFLEEGIRITVVYHRFKAPGRNFHHKRETAWGSIAVSGKRIIGYAFRKRVVHLPLDRAEIKSVKFSCVDGKVLVIDIDPSVFDPRRSGRLEVRFHTERALEAYGIIRDLIDR